MAFGIADGLFVLAFVREFVPDFSGAPLVVGTFLYPLDPMVGDTHRHPEIESYSTVLERGGQSGHSADVLGDGECVGIHFPDEHIGEGQIFDGVLIDPLVEIVVVSDEVLAQAVVPIQHAGHAVEPESVQMVFLHPEFAVGKKEVFRFVLAVVEAPGPPCRMVSLGTGIEVYVLPSVEKAEAFSLIVDAVGMHYIHNHGDPQAMGVVDEGLELFRRPESGRQGVEVGHLVSERPVVGMLLEGHYLEGVIPHLGHVREHILAELLESGDFLLLGRHSYVAFVDERIGTFAGSRILPLVFYGGVPDLGTEDLGHRVLDRTGDVCRKPFSSSARPFDIKFVEFPVAEEHRRQFYLPVAAPQGSQFISRRPFPVVELPDEVHPVGIGRPLPENPGAVIASVESVIDVIVHHIGDGSVTGYPLFQRQDPLMAKVYLFLVREKVLVRIINHAERGLLRFFRFLFFHDLSVFRLWGQSVKYVPSVLRRWNPLSPLRWILSNPSPSAGNPCTFG